MISGENQAYN